MRSFKRGWAAVLACAVVFAACGQSQANPQRSQSGPSILRIGIGAYPASFNSNMTPSAPATTMYQAMFDTLTESNSTKGGQVSPRLATSWTLVDDRTWEFKLRSDVRWHDGTPFTSDDVVATIDLLLNGKPASYYAIRMTGVTSAEAVDKNTVRLKMSTKNAFIPVGAEDVYIYQAAVIKAGGNDAVNKTPMGTGPFKLKSKEDGVSVTLEKSADYWGTKPKLDQIVFKALTEDGTRIAALEAGEIDIAFNVPADDAKRLQAKGIDVQAIATGQSMVLNMKTVNPNTPFAKKQVRHALNYAIDKDALIKDVLLGYGQKLNGQVVGKDGTGFNDKLSAYPYDLNKAKQMLAEAGYPNGFQMTFYTSQGRYAKQKEVSEAIAGQLKNAGIDVKLQVLEWGAYFSGLPTFDVNLVGYNYFPAMDADYVLLQFLCSSYFKVMCNAQYDQLLQQSRSEADPLKRVAILQQLQQILNDEAPVVFLYQSPDIYGVAKRVQGFTPTPDNLIHVLPITVN